MTDFSAIAHDLDLCDLGIVLTKGKRRKAFQQHRLACFKAIKEQNKADGLDSLSADELYAELSTDFSV